MRRFKILIAEDNLVNQKIAQLQLKKIGYETDLAGNGREALEAAKRRPYDLILMDCHMPEMDGYQATQAIRAKVSQVIPIIAMTASAIIGEREKCLRAGMNDYITKPVDPKALRSLLSRWLSPAASVQALDLEKIEGILVLGETDGIALLIELTATFVEQSALQLEGMLSAFERKDSLTLAQCAHTLKSGSAHMGALKVSRSCGRIEAKAGEGDGIFLAQEETASLRALLDDLAKQIPEAVEGLQVECRRRAEKQSAA